MKQSVTKGVTALVLLAIAGFVTIATGSQAISTPSFWVRIGPDIHNANTGSVGIGTPAQPGAKLTVADDLQVVGASPLVIDAGDVEGPHIYCNSKPLKITAPSLDVEGVVQTAEGILFADSTLQTTASPRATYRWAVFSTYDQSLGWVGGNNPSLFGGVAPSTWTDGSATAQQISPDKGVQRTLFTMRGFASNNALVYSDSWSMYSSTNGKIAAVLFRVRNATAASVDWPLYINYTAYANWGELASVALNGVNFMTAGTSSGVPALVTLPIPPDRTSTIIVVSASGTPNQTGTNTFMRTTHLSFANGSLALPAGLEFVDDLDTATGGYEQ